MKKIIVIVFVILIFAVGYIFYDIGYKVYNPKYEYIKENNDKSIEVLKSDDNIITNNTKMIYRYYYKNEDKVQVMEDLPPYFLIGLNKDTIQSYMKDWEVLSFSKEEVVLQKVIKTTSIKKYMTGIKNNMVAIFNEDGTLKEITNVTIQSVDEDEKVSIIAGIEIVGDDELARFLESLDS